MGMNRHHSWSDLGDRRFQDCTALRFPEKGLELRLHNPQLLRGIDLSSFGGLKLLDWFSEGQLRVEKINEFGRVGCPMPERSTVGLNRCLR